VIHRYRRLWLLVGVLAAVLAAPGGALAAVELDATLTVHWIDPVTLLPIDGAVIHVTARQGDAVIGKFEGTTDATGTAVLTGLPRETGEGGAVALDVVGNKETSFTDEETGCVLADSWHAERLAVQVDGPEIAVDFTPDDTANASSLACPPDQPAPTGGVEGAQGTPGRTLPPTDSIASASAKSTGAAVVAVGLLGLSAGLFMLLPRRRPVARRVRK
jgi:hypothetical protein